MANVAVLVTCCIIACVSPLAGVVVLLVGVASLFHLYRFAEVAIGIGYVGLSDVFVIVLAVSTYVRAKKRHRDRDHKSLPYERDGACNRRASGGAKGYSDERFCRQTMVSAIAPFLVWQTLCGGVGLVSWWGEASVKYVVRYWFTGSMVWSIAFVIWTLRRRYRDLLRAVVTVAIVTAVIHLALQLTDYRPLMQSAYWRYVPESEFLESERALWLGESEFVRGSPQGIVMILFAALLSLGRVFETGRSKWWGVSAGILVLATLVTLSRGVLLALTVATASMGVVWFVRAATMRDVLRRYVVLVAVTFGVGSAIGVTACVRPRFVQAWVERLEGLSVELRVWSDGSDSIRGLDNFAAMRAIAEKPIGGWGMPRYPVWFSVRERPPDNIHPVLMLALAGGWINVVLAMRVLGVVFGRFWIRSGGSPGLRQRLLPYFAMGAAMVSLNVTGAGGYAGGTFHGVTALVSALFVGLMACELAAFRQDCGAVAGPREWPPESGWM